MQDLKINTIQTHLHWEDIDKNIAHFDTLIRANSACDLIVLPEMFTTGFTMNPSQFSKQDLEKGFAFIEQLSNELNIAICGSLVKANALNTQYTNTMVFQAPKKEPIYYNKRHLFSPGDETKHYEKGAERIIIEYKNWRICPLICYDLRFPVFSRNRKDYDLLIYVANWPEVRNYAWETLLKARAIENQAYVIACNRVGLDGKGVNHIGNSGIVNPMGEFDAIYGSESVHTSLISFSTLEKFRKSFPVLDDADEFTLLI